MKKLVKSSIALILALSALLCFAGCNTFVSKTIFISRSTNFELPDEPGILLNAGQLTESDAKRIIESLKTEYPDEEIGVIPVYTTDTTIFMNGEILHIYAIDPNHASFLGLEEMADGTAYFETEQSGEIELEINVITEIEENGITCGDIAYKTLNSQSGVAKKSLLSVLKEEKFAPSMAEDAVCFVTTNTLAEIAELACVVENPDKAGSIYNVTEIIGICVYADNTETVSEYLSGLGYVVK